MGKYRGRSNEDRRAKNQRQVEECCVLPPDGREFLEQATELLTAGEPIDTKHKDRGPVAKIHALLSGNSTSAQSAALKALGAPVFCLSPTLALNALSLPHARDRESVQQFRRRRRGTTAAYGSRAGSHLLQ